MSVSSPSRVVFSFEVRESILRAIDGTVINPARLRLARTSNVAPSPVTVGTPLVEIARVLDAACTCDRETAKCQTAMLARDSMNTLTDS
jgi:hypothetical protein